VQRFRVTAEPADRADTSTACGRFALGDGGRLRTAEAAEAAAEDHRLAQPERRTTASGRAAMWSALVVSERRCHACD